MSGYVDRVKVMARAAENRGGFGGVSPWLYIPYTDPGCYQQCVVSGKPASFCNGRCSGHQAVPYFSVPTYPFPVWTGQALPNRGRGGGFSFRRAAPTYLYYPQVDTACWDQCVRASVPQWACSQRCTSYGATLGFG